MADILPLSPTARAIFILGGYHDGKENRCRYQIEISQKTAGSPQTESGIDGPGTRRNLRGCRNKRTHDEHTTRLQPDDDGRLSESF